MVLKERIESSCMNKKLIEKVEWVRKETLKIHRKAPETRIASSLSPVEIFVSLFYGDLLETFPKDPLNVSRDRLVISKGTRFYLFVSNFS